MYRYLYLQINVIISLGLMHLSVTWSSATYEILNDEKYKTCLTRFNSRNTTETIKPMLVDWICLQKLIKKVNGIKNGYNPAHKNVDDPKQSSSAANEIHPRVRQEYRTYTDEQRRRFHIALNKVKNHLLDDGTSWYDAIANLHSGVNIPKAHRGPGFLNWHRQYLLILEDALRTFDPDIAIPYWDSTLDNELPDPVDSIMWHETFAGNGRGNVTTGPFAQWNSPEIPLYRKTGSEGRLFTQNDIDNFLSKINISDISSPNADNKSNIEQIHGCIHNWVGGQMEDLETAPYDPVFFIHHSFVDLIYEEFKDKLLKAGIDILQGWPEMPNNSFHLLDSRMSISSSMTHRDMLQSNIKEIYTYALRPTCSNGCGNSTYLKCDSSKDICMPITNYEEHKISFESVLNNTYCPDNTMCNITYWVYIPIQIFVKGNAINSYIEKDKIFQSNIGKHNDNVISFKHDNSYHILKASLLNPMVNRPKALESNENAGYKYNAEANYMHKVNLEHMKNNKNTNKIQSPHLKLDEHNYKDKLKLYFGKKALQNNIRKKYKRSKEFVQLNHFSSPGLDLNTRRPSHKQVRIQSYGLTYVGTHGRYVSLDYRSELVTYAVVINPQYGKSLSLIKVYDSVGEPCRAECFIRSKYTSCDGLIRLTDQEPLQYSDSDIFSRDLLPIIRYHCK